MVFAPQAIHSKAIDRAMDDDREWFASHPGVRWRIRDPMPFEFNGPLEPATEGYAWRVVVALAAEGIRLRGVVQVPFGTTDNDAKRTAKRQMSPYVRDMRRIFA